MPIDPIMPLVYVQDMGPTAKLVHDAAVRPEAAQAMAKSMAEEMLREQSKQVQKLEENEMASGISDEDGGSGGKGQQQSGNRRRSEEEPDETLSQGYDPFVGKLVNKKV